MYVPHPRYSRAAVAAWMILYCVQIVTLGEARAQTPDQDEYWQFVALYNDTLLNVHSLANYAFDLEWRFEWEQRQLADNALRLGSGSVASDGLLTDLDININEPLNDKWRFQGRFIRYGTKQLGRGDDQLWLGLERSVFKSSAIYFMINPQYEKEFLDLTAGYTFYKDDRQQYVRLGVFLEDYEYEAKNRVGGKSEQDPIAMQWQVRFGLGNEWYLYTEGDVGTGFERVFEDPVQSPEVERHSRRENAAELRLSRFDAGQGWSVWAQWIDLQEAKEFRDPADLFFDYRTTQTILSGEHIRIFGDRHRWRFMLHYVDFQAKRTGHFAHEFDRTDIVGGVFYEYLWPRSGLTVALTAAVPEAEFHNNNPDVVFDVESNCEKFIIGWRHDFSPNAKLRILLSQEIVPTEGGFGDGGFGGGSVQFQMFF